MTTGVKQVTNQINTILKPVCKVQRFVFVQNVSVIPEVVSVGGKLCL